MKLTREQAKAFTWSEVDPELGLTIEADQQVDTSRWMSIHQLVLKDRDGKLWAATYEQGLTEMQDCQPFEYDIEVEFYEVDKVPVTTYEYRRRPEGGVREPLGSGPDSPPAGVDGIPGPVGGESRPLEIPGGDPAVDWPVLLEHCSYECIWEGGMEMQPDGTWDIWEGPRPARKTEAAIPS